MKNEYFKQLDEVSPGGDESALSWLAVDRKKVAFKVTGVPKREEAEPEIQEQLIVEYYSR
jgi:small subunit ribosomal protein S4